MRPALPPLALRAVAAVRERGAKAETASARQIVAGTPWRPYAPQPRGSR